MLCVEESVQKTHLRDLLKLLLEGIRVIVTKGFLSKAGDSDLPGGPESGDGGSDEGGEVSNLVSSGLVWFKLLRVELSITPKGAFFLNTAIKNPPVFCSWGSILMQLLIFTLLSSSS